MQIYHLQMNQLIFVALFSMDQLGTQKLPLSMLNSNSIYTRFLLRLLSIQAQAGFLVVIWSYEFFTFAMKNGGVVFITVYANSVTPGFFFSEDFFQKLSLRLKIWSVFAWQARGVVSETDYQRVEYVIPGQQIQSSMVIVQWCGTSSEHHLVRCHDL